MMVALALPALAQDRRGGSLDRVLPHVRQTVPGRFYDAEGPFFGPDGRPTYRLKWMTPDNRIIWFSVDAQTGRVLDGAPSGPPPATRYREDRNWQSPPPPPQRNNWQDNSGRDDRGNWGRGNDGWGDRSRSPDDNRGGWGNGDNRGDRSGQGNWGGRGDQGGGRGDQGGSRGNDNRGGSRRRNGG